MSVTTYLSPVPQSAVIAFRDDGFIAAQLGRIPAGQLAPLPPALVSLAVIAVLLSTGIAGVRELAVFIPVITLLLVAPTAEHPHNGRLDWLVPPILRVTEYGYIAGAGLAWESSPILIFAVLGAMAFHHYDLVFRLRERNYPPGWLAAAGLGWEGRMLLAGLAVLLGMVTFSFLLLAAYLWCLFGWESMTSWLGAGKGK